MLLKLFLSAILFSTVAFTKDTNMSIYDFKVKDINGKEILISQYENKVLLIVNVASKCG